MRSVEGRPGHDTEVLGLALEAQNAFFLILRNAIRFGALAMLGSFLYFIGGQVILVVGRYQALMSLVSVSPVPVTGILVISGATGLGGYYIFQAFHPQMSLLMKWSSIASSTPVRFDGGLVDYMKVGRPRIQLRKKSPS